MKKICFMFILLIASIFMVSCSDKNTGKASIQISEGNSIQFVGDLEE